MILEIPFSGGSELVEVSHGYVGSIPEEDWGALIISSNNICYFTASLRNELPPYEAANGVNFFYSARFITSNGRARQVEIRASNGKTCKGTLYI